MFEQDIKVIFNRRIASDTFLMGFRSSQIASESRPGQFVMLRVNPGMDPLLRRPFSICCVMEENLLCILYRVVGKGTEVLSEMGEGERLSMLGPLGKGFQMPERDKKVLLVAGGIGLAPLFFLAQTLKRTDVEFMAGFTSSSEIIDIQKIEDLPLKISLATDDGTKGYSGMITDLLSEYLQQNQEEEESCYIYACGPMPMLKRVVSIAADRNISCQVSIESAMACGVGACQGCAVKASSQERQKDYHHVCTDGPVFSADTIDWKKI